MNQERFEIKYRTIVIVHRVTTECYYKYYVEIDLFLLKHD